MKKIICIQRVLPEYRKNFFLELSNRFHLKILYGRGAFNGAQKNADVVEDLPAVMCKSLTWHFRTKKMDYFISVFPGLFIYILREKPDVILTEGTTNILNNLIVYFYSFVFGVPVIWWDAGRDANKKLGKLRRFFEILLIIFQKNSEAILTYTEGGRSYFINNGVKDNDIFVINNFSPVEVADNLVDRVSILRKSLMIPYYKKVLLVVGAIERRKLIYEFIAEASKSETLRNDAVIIYVGDGPERNSLIEVAKKSGLTCQFVGAIYKGKDAFYSLSDALVLPGWSTLAIVEALTFKKPAFIPEFGGPEHIFVEDGVTGLKHDKNNLSQLIKNLEDYIGGYFVPNFSAINKSLPSSVKEMVDNAEMAINHCLNSRDD